MTQSEIRKAEKVAREAWIDFDKQHPFTLGHVDAFIEALHKGTIPTELCKIILPEDNDGDHGVQGEPHGRHDNVWEMTFGVTNQVRLVGEMGSNEQDNDVIDPEAELEAYHRGYNVWIVVPTSSETARLMENLVHCIAMQDELNVLPLSV